jgi:ComEC/Rec2-related protein
MPRKTAKLTVFYIFGLAAASFLRSFAGVYIGAAFFLIGVLSAIFSKKLYAAKLFTAAFGIGLIIWSLFFGIKYDTAVLYDGLSAEIVGEVTDINEFSGGRAVYAVDGNLNGKTAATVTAFISENDNRAAVGDTIRIFGKLQTLDNSYTFASEDINAAKGIFLQFKTVNSVEIISQNENIIKTFADLVRMRIYTVSAKRLDGSENGLFKAMLFGDRDGISDEANLIFSRAGVSHIMAVSGAQLSIICSIAFILLEALKIGRFKRFFICLLLIGFFLIICENSVSIERAAIMIIITFAVPLINRQSDTATSLAVSVIALTLHNPFIIRDAGFLLSVFGVLAVAVISPPVIARMKSDFTSHSGKIYMHIRDIFISSIIVSLTLFPISFLFFDEVSVLSPLTNIFLIPISTLVIILGMIVVLCGGIMPVSALLFPTIAVLCDLTMIIAKFAAALPFSFIPTGLSFERPLIVIFIVSALAVSLLFSKGNRLKTAASAILTAFAVFIISVSIFLQIPDNTLYAAMLGDEKSAAVVIHDKFEAVVIDLKGSGNSAAAVRKYLSSQGISDIAVLTADENAVRSIPAYMEYFPSEFYDIGLYAAPSEIALPASVIFPSQGGEFYEQNGGFIEYKNARTEFFDEYIRIILSEKKEILIADKSFENTPETEEIIYISGTYFEKSANEKFIAALDSSAAVSADTATDVIIGKSFRIRDDGKVTVIY